MTIKVDDVERAVDWLRDNASQAAQARAERLYMEQWIKTVLAQEMRKCGDVSAASAEKDARCSVPFIAALAAYKEAVQIDETNRFLREAASAKIEAYRTFEATRRTEGKAYS